MGIRAQKSSSKKMPGTIPFKTQKELNPRHGFADWLGQHSNLENSQPAVLSRSEMEVGNGPGAFQTPASVLGFISRPMGARNPVLAWGLAPLEGEFSLPELWLDKNRSSSSVFLLKLLGAKTVVTVLKGRNFIKILAPVLVIVSGNSLVFSLKIITNTDFSRCCSPTRQHQ